MNKLFFGIFLLGLSVACFATSVKGSAKKEMIPQYTLKSAALVGAVDSREIFSRERLFAMLDSAGGTGTWMEWDVNGVKDPSVMDVLNPMLKSKNIPKMIWVLTERAGKPLMSVLLPKGDGEVLVFYELKSLDAKPEALSINKVLNPDVVLRDYKQVNGGEYVHRDQPNLKVFISENIIRFTYEKKGEEPLILNPGFAQMNGIEKRMVLRDYKDYFKYEYALILRAFVQSTRSIFNWQAWHWYMPSWSDRYKMSERELEAILMKGDTPPYFTLFKARTAKGESVELRTNGSGFSELLIKTKN